MPAWLFGLTFFGSYMRCIACIDTGSILGLVTGSTAGALHASFVRTACTGAVVPVVPVWASLGHCRPLWPATMWENKVSHLGNSLIMIITAKILKSSCINSES